MRVLLVTDWQPLEGGTERYVELLGDGLRAAGDEVRMMTSSAGSAGGGGAHYVALGTNRRAAKAGLQIFNPSAYLTMRDALREFRPDAVIVNMFLRNLSASVLGPLRQVPTELIVHDYVSICPTGSKLLENDVHCTLSRGRACRQSGCIGGAHAVQAAVRYAYFRSELARCVDHVSTISDWMRTELRSNGIEAGLLDLPVRPPAVGFKRAPSPSPMFLYGGRLDSVKGVDVLIRAFATLSARHPDARLRICGDGPQRDELLALVTDLGLSDAVSFSIRMSPDWVHELSPAWAVVMPSVYSEPLGLVAIEAIIHGVPVIASASGGLTETVEDGISGLLVQPGDVRGLAEALGAIARRDAFAGHSVTESAITSATTRHHPETHIGAVRELLHSLNGSAV